MVRNLETGIIVCCWRKNNYEYTDLIFPVVSQKNLEEEKHFDFLQGNQQVYGTYCSSIQKTQAM